MKLIIDVPKEDYKEVLKDTYSGTSFENKIFTAIANGIPLSKNHGKLVDLNEVHILLDNYMYNINGLHDYLNEELEIVVEADKEITDETDN